ncbi:MULTISPECIES: L-serine ammonia-lyase [Bartonella]|uniref:L-serine dehydratase n=1 Tax=Bartonella rochalimae ATCC BAA-1498 TaxID=685782 RepID=E6YM78_9HYPH|nr:MULTISPECIES: L-serine ammonia-lyase [Bartonella]AQX18225.1 L-serine ammonia-lyase [Bartonella sp. A1379B]AQX22740.1 L-serine dehydratase [Bartonella sp. 11B]AQX23974.1 L-serine dehydratase [Bartonella sp. 114]AQX25189.1 L-serine ammonia-lyase [Bartonella sp. Coyote22sub2]KEC56956.1 L-serine ammonia-lyase [Bartonella rochalimae ATCC BAA-1498]
MFLSVFEIFKIGIGPSSSHTMGPMLAANMFLQEIIARNLSQPSRLKISHIRVYLHGSLAFTGIGHATDRAVVLGLLGEKASTVDPDCIGLLFEQVKREKKVWPEGHPVYRFDLESDLIFERKRILPGHANGLAFEGLNAEGSVLLRQIYYSIGGGFVVTEDELNRADYNTKVKTSQVPYPFDSADKMLSMAKASGFSIAEMKRINEETKMDRAALNTALDEIFSAMINCIDRGLLQEGELPGGLCIPRRAKRLHDKLLEDQKKNCNKPLLANDWLSVYAMAVNEENAAGGRIVTAPTNGAAGVVSAVLRYYTQFHDGADKEGIHNFLLTAAAIGGIIKHNASISGAEVGCQGEVGAASAMAAAGLTAALGGTPAQIENAAEIALEHHLGMTCDPVSGLVQVPCIERNAMGAVKAVTASSLALHGNGNHFVSLDTCIETMRQTGHDMSERYKETSKGGLALNVLSC